jgi:hypothetical protein
MTTRHRFAGAVILAVATVSIGCSKPNPDSTTSEAAKPTLGELSIAELETRMSDASAGKLKLAIYDNNSKERYAESHVPSAKWVDFKHVTAADLPADKETTLVFYCAHQL